MDRILHLSPEQVRALREVLGSLDLRGWPALVSLLQQLTNECSLPASLLTLSPTPPPGPQDTTFTPGTTTASTSASASVSAELGGGQGCTELGRPEMVPALKLRRLSERGALAVERWFRPPKALLSNQIQHLKACHHQCTLILLLKKSLMRMESQRVEEVELLEEEGLDGDFCIAGVDGLEDDHGQIHWTSTSDPAMRPDPHSKLLLSYVTQGPESDVNDPQCQAWIAGMKSLAFHLPWESGVMAYSTDSLWSLVDRCYRVFAVRGAVDFVAMLNLVQLSMKVDSMLKAWIASYKVKLAENQAKKGKRKRTQEKPEKLEKPSVTGIYHHHLENIVCHTSRSRIDIFSQRDCRAPYEFYLCKDALGKYSSCMWSSATAVYWGYYVEALPSSEVFGAGVHCADLEVTDEVFSTMNNNLARDFKLIDRDWDIWRGVFPSKAQLTAPVPYYQFQQTLLSAPSSAPPTTPASSVRALTPESPLSGMEEFEDDLIGAPSMQAAYVLEELAQRTTITTNFNPLSETNKRRPFPQPGPEREQWTLRQRDFAARAPQPDSIEDLQEQKSFYSEDGIKSAPNSYVRVAPSIFAGLLTASSKDVLFEGQDDSFLCLILGDMPTALRESLERNVETCMGARSTQPLLRHIQSPDELAEFVTVHFSHYMRMGQDGFDTPKHIHPWFLKCAGVARTNHTQMTPYESKEMLDNFVEYDALCNALDQVFAWIEKKLKAHLGNLYYEIACYADEIPGRKASPCHPFAGFVLNFNIATKGHRDGKDLKACLVIPIGSFDGETQASLVCHSDATGWKDGEERSVGLPGEHSDPFILSQWMADSFRTPPRTFTEIAFEY
ncbi:hypothetical protein LXA43DRAFT_1062202 [Ganoderma leucocontextum]|nr:hypothetical protein LXA43DRAFT_1062202 [Ganoderma leucocontextum]